ncbi:MAG: hypothetical protein K0Q95_1066 [Bacteroidota bacterium]|jgi:hypothetical protein|nr:hypothetical protein [Bacteroidota bacterium]
MKRSAIYFLLFLSFSGYSQDLSRENQVKRLDSICLYRINPLVKQLYSVKIDEQKTAVNQQLLSAFKEAMEVSGTFDYDFDSVSKKDIAILRSPDNKFRIIHWDLMKADGTFDYYGFLQAKHYDVIKKGFRKTKKETIQLYPLIDRSSEIKNPENAVTDNKKWFGMRYNRIILSKTKSKTYYTLLGWDGNDQFSQKKIIDVLSFDKAGVPLFGAAIFNYQKKYPKRVIFEYSTKCIMPLKYSTRKDSIVFGHLAPIEPKFEGQYQYYCNDLSVDGFGFKKGKWNYKADLNMLNEKDDKDKFYGNPHDRSITNNESNNYNTEIRKRSKSKKKKKE